MICDACGTDFEGDAGEGCPVCAPTQGDLDQLVELFGLPPEIVGPAGSAGSSPPGVDASPGPPLSRSRNDLVAADTGAPEAAAAGPSFLAAIESIRRRLLEAAHELAPVSMIAESVGRHQVRDRDQARRCADAIDLALHARALCAEAAELLRSLSPRNDSHTHARSRETREKGGVPCATPPVPPAPAGSLRVA